MRESASLPDTVVLDGESLTPEDVAAVARDDAPVEIDAEARERMRESRARVESVLDSGEPVYGVNTGFGHLVETHIDRKDIERLQTNLVRSHSAGAGRELTRPEVRSMMVTRVNTLAKGYSGIRPAVVELLVSMLNEGVHPAVRSRGSLGASGDLAPLAHMALVLIGEGEAHVGGDRLPGADALAAVGLEPVTLKSKEGLALINGTQLTVGLASLFVVDAERIVDAADAAGALTTEVTMGTTANCDPAVHEVRPHAGQQESAAAIRRLTEGSTVLESHKDCERVQDAYSIRCLPQVNGAVRDAVGHLREAVDIELNSVTDNPLVFPAGSVDERAPGTDVAAVVSAGNFHGEPLALRLDYAAGALTELAAISERRTDRMLNPDVQEPYLPPFLTEHSGLRSGYMIAQYTAAALLNECRSFGRPSLDSTPVSGGQEDHVSMSGQSALNARVVAANVATIVGVELLCGAQAAEFLEAGLELGRGTGAVRDAIRSVVPPLNDDRPLDGELEDVSDLVRFGAIRLAANEATR
ncbi:MULTISPECIES: histidine ammonia-lyase [Haloferax]|uniref:Probable histidine ammonia-lyase n=1 Tax=Haloferax marinum TaxID=2666143 RepID=A0A6A8GE16_9EURY|nr:MULTISPECIES: histidine ammonia-lyase [Haloferax]KAB1191160.1 histidine ammonia-lyase [Haloferax sp. CBA1150]MRW98046.1 histidine ammonia-lyase [Haloferax marinum]